MLSGECQSCLGKAENERQEATGNTNVVSISRASAVDSDGALPRVYDDCESGQDEQYSALWYQDMEDSEPP